MKHNLIIFPCGSSKICSQIECCQHPKIWKKDFEAELPLVFAKIYEKIEWILTHIDVANKRWFLEQLESLSTFVELREKEILGVC